MKNNIFTILLMWISLVLCSCETREDNYIIKSISLKQVFISDSLDTDKNTIF